MKTRKRIDSLTAAERERFPEWVSRCIEIGLRTGPSDRPRMEAGIREHYAIAGLEQPARIVWVPSPLVGAFAFPAASLILAMRKNPVDVAVDDAVHVAVHVAVDGAVGGAVHDAVDDAVRGAVGVAVDGAVHDAVGVAVDGAVHDAVGVAVDGAVGDAVGGAVGDAVDGAVHDVYKSVLQKSWHLRLGGQFWQWTYAWATFFVDVCHLDIGADFSRKLNALRDVTEAGCWWWPHRDFVMICERPTHIDRDRTDARGRLHSHARAAIAWPDGFGVYRSHGVTVPASVITAPQTITVAQIDAETNAEVKRVMIDRYGVGRYLLDSGCKQVHRDECGILLRKEVPNDEPILLVRALNSTPEPDGTMTTSEAIDVFGELAVRKALKGATPNGQRWKQYFLRVHPELRPMLATPEGEDPRYGEPQEMTAKNAISSRCGLRGEQYNVVFES